MVVTILPVHVAGVSENKPLRLTLVHLWGQNTLNWAMTTLNHFECVAHHSRSRLWILRWTLDVHILYRTWGWRKLGQPLRLQCSIEIPPKKAHPALTNQYQVGCNQADGNSFIHHHVLTPPSLNTGTFKSKTSWNLKQEVMSWGRIHISSQGNGSVQSDNHTVVLSDLGTEQQQTYIVWFSVDQLVTFQLLSV